MALTPKDIYIDFSYQDIRLLFIIQYEKNTRIYNVHFSDNGIPFLINSTKHKVRLQMMKPDKRLVFSDDCITINDDGSVLLKFDDNMCVADGIADCQFIIQDITDASWTRSPKFRVKIQKSVVDDDAIASTDEFSALTNLIDSSTENITIMEELKNTVANAEEIRIASEITRTENETDRKSSELMRKSDEATRISNEETRISQFNTIKTESTTVIKEAENVNAQLVESNNSCKMKITDRNGVSTDSPNLLNTITIGTVETGEYNEDATASLSGSFGEQKLNLRIPQGVPFKIVKTYASIADMNSHFTDTDVNTYEFVMIDTGNVEDEDNAKLYRKDTTQFSYVTDLSGAQGIQGVKGETGNTPAIEIGNVTTGNEGTSASVEITGTNENPIFNFTIPKGDTGNIGAVCANDIPYSSITDEVTIMQKVDNVESCIGDKYSNARTYSVNDYCIYNDSLYKCVAAITSSESFDSTKWEVTNIANETKNNSSAIAKNTDDITSINSDLHKTIYSGQSVRAGNKIICNASEYTVFELFTDDGMIMIGRKVHDDQGNAIINFGCTTAINASFGNSLNSTIGNYYGHADAYDTHLYLQKCNLIVGTTEYPKGIIEIRGIK